MRISLGSIELFTESLLQRRINIVFNPVSRLVQMVVRQSEVLLHIGLPQPVPPHNITGMDLPGGGQLILTASVGERQPAPLQALQ